MLSVTTKQIDEALSALKAGKVIVYPTETSYGIGCDATNNEAVKRIFGIKGREYKKALPVILPTVESAKNYVEVDTAFRKLSEMYWPGPLNIIASIKKATTISDYCSKNNTQSVRVSSHPFVSILAQRFGKPIVATSANISGQDSIYSIKSVKEVFINGIDKPDVIIDGGDLPKLVPSTTAYVKGASMRIVRQGGIVISGM